MAEFSICFEQNKTHDSAYPTGYIQIGDFVERFQSDFSYWQQPRYQAHWVESIERILTRGRKRSCLVTAMRDPSAANYIFWWRLFKEGKEIIFQNQVLVLADLKSCFDEDNLYDYIGWREPQTRKGMPISQWRIPVSDLAPFLAEHRP